MYLFVGLERNFNNFARFGSGEEIYILILHYNLASFVCFIGRVPSGVGYFSSKSSGFVVKSGDFPARA